MDPSHTSAKEEELQALAAIYGNGEFSFQYSKKTSCYEVKFLFQHNNVALSNEAGFVEFLCHLTPSYPLEHPQCEINVRLNSTAFSWIPQKDLDDILAHIKEILESSENQPVLFSIAEYLRETTSLLWNEFLTKRTPLLSSAASPPPEISSTSEFLPVTQLEDPICQDGQFSRENIFSSEVILEKKSTFQAHVALVCSSEHLERVRRELLADRKIASATHNVMAFRYLEQTSGKPSILKSDYDDDGETNAGGRLLHLLEILNLVNIVVIVSRWYGGVKLGPLRFKIFNNIARNAITASGFWKDKNNPENSSPNDFPKKKK